MNTPDRAPVATARKRRMEEKRAIEVVERSKRWK
jgi:hypothetical protein